MKEAQRIIVKKDGAHFEYYKKILNIVLLRGADIYFGHQKQLKHTLLREKKEEWRKMEKNKKWKYEKKNELVKKYGRGVLKENLVIYGMMLPTLLLILLFCYFPMYGLIIAFQDYVPGAAFLGPDVEWVGLKWFVLSFWQISFAKIRSV